MSTRVLWLLKGLGPGGAERLLVEHARLGDRTRFEYEVAYLLPTKQHLVEPLEALGVATRCLDVRSAADPRWIVRLRRLVRERGYDVVHIHSPALAALARPVLRLRGARPVVVYTEHNRWPSHHPVTRLANRLTLDQADATVAVSEDVRRSMGRQGAGVEVLFHGVDTTAIRAGAPDRAEARRLLGVGPDELLAVTVANLVADKGYPTLLAAARAAVDAEPRLRFVAAGQGPLETEVCARAAESGLGDRFRLLGYVPGATRVTAAADVFVLASDHEGVPVAVMEALALGVPVVATAVGGVPELVEDGTSGLLVPPRDPDALAKAIIRATEGDTHARLSRGAAARGASIDGRAAIARLDELYAELSVGSR